MNKKVKLLIFSSIAVISSITAVYAVSLISASDVIYDNKKSGSPSDNVQGAIDDLYDLKGGTSSSGTSGSKRGTNLIDYITNLAATDTTNLLYDETDDKNLRYIGSNPNNYVLFNNELWRIIGIMNNVRDADGTSASRIKLMRSESIGDISWDTNKKYIWSTSTLQELLNKGDYYNKSGSYSSNGLTDESKEMISSVVWNLGGLAYNGSYFPPFPDFYKAERGDDFVTGGAKEWTGYVGLMYPSDYGYSMGGSNRSTCLSTNLYQAGNNGGIKSTTCPSTSWIYNKRHQYTINVRTKQNITPFFVAEDGRVDNNDYNYTNVAVRPVVYLNTDIRKTGGNGTEDDPYKISLPFFSNDTSNASPPKLDEDGKLIPITLANDGKVTYVTEEDENWYNYGEKQWANAVILVDSPSKTYKEGDNISESDIESYFVWIPKYKYRLWNTGTASKNAHEIDIVFDTTDTKDIEGESCKTPMTSGATGNCDNGEYMTHPAFISLGVDGFWVGKFETGYKGATSTSSAEINSSDSSKIIIKPNVYSWRNNTVYNFFVSSYNYERTLDSHMMKNTEWGAVAYLSHSKYGINREVNINNNSSYKTGYSSLPTISQVTYPGTYGDGSSYNQAYNTTIGYLASTTGNITGVYDMSGGAHEYMASYRSATLGSSGFSTTTLASYNAKYFDVYNASSTVTNYQYSILGDATSEMGPMQSYKDGDATSRSHNSWYADYSYFIESSNSWFDRGGDYPSGILAGQFRFDRAPGSARASLGTRLVLSF